MARTSTYTCKTCGTKFEFCVKCQFTRPNYDAENFCSKDHAEIYAILSKHGCNLITADEALTELKAYNIDEIKFVEDVAAHVERIKSEATVRAEVPAPKAETEAPVKIVKQFNKNNKKKW